MWVHRVLSFVVLSRLSRLVKFVTQGAEERVWTFLSSSHVVTSYFGELFLDGLENRAHLNSTGACPSKVKQSWSLKSFSFII